MTDYLNFSATSKKEWLMVNGVKLEVAPLHLEEGDYVLVCLIDNGLFDAAAVVDSERDLMDFRDQEDDRPRSWWIVERKRVQQEISR